MAGTAYRALVSYIVAARNFEFRSADAYFGEAERSVFAIILKSFADSSTA